MKRVFIIHGWEGYPEEGWFPWLKKMLEKDGHYVEIPLMPNADKPDIGEWKSHINKIVAKPDSQTYFVGHSIGCQAIMRYLESLADNIKIGGAVFVAGWLTLMNLETEEEKEIAREWLENPIDLAKVKRTISKTVAIFSTNDPVVPMENKKLFEDKLDAKTIMESDKGHFSGSDGITELPCVYKAIKEIMT